MSNNEPSWYRYLKGIGIGTTSGIAVTLVGHPFDTIKVRLQTQSPSNPIYNGISDCIIKTIKWEGIRGLYKGVASPISGQVLFRTSLFGTYYESLYYLKEYSKNKELLLKDYFIAGGVTGFVASFTDGPIELFKSKMQFQIIAEKNNVPLSMKYSGVWHCFTHTLNNYGIRGVYQGLGATIGRDLPGYFFYFGSNEYYKRLITPKGKTVADLGMLEIMCCAGVTGITFWTLMFNIDVIKSAMMADDIDRNKRKYKNIIDCACKLYTNEGGYKRFWRGFVPCLYRAFLANAMMLYVVDVTKNYFPSYEFLSKYISN